MILVAGGSDDPNLRCLIDALEAQGAQYRTLLVGAQANPSVYWDLTADRLWVNDEILEPSSVFVRYDVFQVMTDSRPDVTYRAHAWYACVLGWALAHQGVRLLNRLRAQTPINKPYILSLAQRCGLATAATVVSNDIKALQKAWDGVPAIAKPAVDGDYCASLDDILADTPTRGGIAASPCIVQARLVPPEVRLFLVGDVVYAFDVQSSELDYRTDPHVRVTLRERVPEAEAENLKRLGAMLGQDFGAADFKTCPSTGRLMFLELNTMPMFAAFDRAADGQLARAIANWLVAPDDRN